MLRFFFSNISLNLLIFTISFEYLYSSAWLVRFNFSWFRYIIHSLFMTISPLLLGAWLEKGCEWSSLVGTIKELPVGKT